MAAEAVGLADALKTWLDNGTYTIGALTPDRRWAPHLDKRDLASVQVSVIPGGRIRTMYSRAMTSDEFTPIITISQTVKVEDTATCDALMLLCEELEERVWASTSLTAGGAKFSRVRTEFELQEEMLWENGMFMAKIECGFKRVA